LLSFSDLIVLDLVTHIFTKYDYFVAFFVVSYHARDNVILVNKC